MSTDPAGAKEFITKQWFQIIATLVLLAMLGFVGRGLQVWLAISKEFVTREVYDIREHSRDGQLQRLQAAVERIEKKVDDQNIVSRMTKLETLIETMDRRLVDLNNQQQR